MPWAEAVAVHNRHILAAGLDRDVLALAGPSTRLLNLHGKIVLPGLCDAHIHFHDWSLAQSEVRLDDTRSKADMLQRIAHRAATLPPNDWIIGRGWNESRWAETGFPHRGRY